MDFPNSRTQQTKSVSFRIGRCFLMESSCSLWYMRGLFFFFFFFVPFTMSSQHKGGEKRKCTNLSIGAKLKLIKKLKSGVSVARVCDEYGVKKQTVSDIRRSKEKLQAYAVKFDVNSNKDKKGVVHTRQHIKVAKSKNLEEAVYKWYVQEYSAGVNVRGVDILDAAVKFVTHIGIPFSGSGGWLWHFRNRHGICNKVVHGETASGDSGVVEPFHLKFQKLIKEEDLSLSQIYIADETCLLWRSLPMNTQAFKNEDKIPRKKLSKDKSSNLLGANASGTHHLKLVVVGKAAKPRCIKDCQQELPIVYYNTQNTWFTAEIFSNWFLTTSSPKCVIFRRKCHALLLKCKGRSPPQQRPSTPACRPTR